MNLTTERSRGVAVVRVGEARLMYPLLSEFSDTITSLIGSGERKLLLDLSNVTYVDSATPITVISISATIHTSVA